MSHSYSNPSMVAVSHTHLALTIDFDRQVIFGTAKIKATRRLGTELKLDQTNLTIHSITGDVISWKIAHDEESSKKKLGEPLLITVPETTTDLNITIAFETSPQAEGIVWMTPEQTRSHAPFMFTTFKTIGARSLFPCQDTPQVRGTFSADLKIKAQNYEESSPLMALISGDNNPTKPNDAMEYKDLRSDSVPIPTYLFAIAAGKFIYQKVNAEIGFYADNSETLKNAQTNLQEDLIKYFTALQGLLGRNPWSHHPFLFLPAMYPYGGMESPQLIYVNEATASPSGANAYSILHKLAHQWIGNVATQKTWQDSWLNEGWTSYLEDRILEMVHGREFAQGHSYQRYLQLKQSNSKRLANPSHPIYSQLTQLYKRNLGSVHPDDFFDFSVYAKGATLFHALEAMLGRNAFDQYAKNYIHQFYLKPVDTRAFIEFSTAELQQTELPVEWNDFFKSWIYERGIKPESLDQMFQVFGIPQCQDCEEKLIDFWQNPKNSQFHKWNPFQIQYLVESMNRNLSNRPGKTGRRINYLKANSDLKHWLKSDPTLKGRWYSLLINAQQWEDQKQDISDFLSENGRTRAILPVFQALIGKASGSESKEMVFAREIFQKNRSRYFPSARDEIEKLVESNRE